MENCRAVEFVKGFFKELERKNIQYGILRNAEEVEAGDAHDIDMSVLESDLLRFEDSLVEFTDSNKWHFHFKSGSACDCKNIKCYHVSYFDDEKKEISICHFDIFPTFSWNGIELLTNTQLMDNIDCTTVFHKVDSAVEATTKLFIRLLHSGKIKEKYKTAIHLVVNQDTEKVMRLFRFFMEEDTAQLIIAKVLILDWQFIEDNRHKIIDSITRIAKRKPGFYKNKLMHTVYLVQKAFSNTGVSAAFEGTDGSGKSTIIDGLKVVLESTYPDGFVDYYHWRPGVIKKECQNKSGEKIVVTDPHANKPYGKTKSFAKFMFFNVDYVLGYWMKIRWQLSKGHFVVFDRYYYDYLMDKIRYRLNISDNLLLWCISFIPKPDITFLLIGDPVVLFNRKKEISIEAISQQIERLKKYGTHFNNSVEVNVNDAIEDVVYGVGKEILLVSEKKRKRV